MSTLLHVRGRDNVSKRVLLQAAAFNLALILRSISGAGTPRGLASDRNLGNLPPSSPCQNPDFLQGQDFSELDDGLTRGMG